MARKYHNLAGLVRDLEHAIECGGTEEWDLLSRFDNALFAIEEDGDSALGGETDMGSVSGHTDGDAAGTDADGAHESGQQSLLPGVPGMGPGVPRGTGAPQGEPVPVGRAERGVDRVARSGGKRRG